MATKHLAKYEIKSTLGKGSMGVVYQAFDPDMARTVAIKTLRSEVLSGGNEEEMLARFRAEAKAYGRLLHPNIVTCYSCDRDNEVTFIVMEYVEGESLKDMLAQGKIFPPEEASAIVGQLLAALAYSHANGVVHRDVKPANIMITPAGQVKVTDFGVAKVDTTAVTQAGYIVGSPSYMSPEQILGQPVDRRTDVYSAGIILYELLTGENPFAGPDLGAVVNKVLHDKPSPPSQRQPGISAALDAVVSRALEKDADLRYQSADEFAAALGGAPSQETAKDSDETETMVVAQPESGAGGSAGTPGRSRKPAMAGITAALALAVGGGAYYLLAPGPQAPPPALPPAGGASGDTLPAAPPRSDTESALQALLSGYACADFSTRIDAGTLTLRGYVSSAAEAETLQNALAALPGVAALDVQINVQPWPYCDVLALLKPHFDPAMGPVTSTTARVAGDRLHFTAGQHLEFAFTAPDFPATTYVDYFTLDGGVAHLLPPPDGAPATTPAGATIAVGSSGRRWEIAPPFGREMVAIISTAPPLWDRPRPEFEDAHAYLQALKQALSQGGPTQLSAHYAFIVTRPTAE
ncbi:MAG TPA: serine/threonine protein kinase [Gammaproteobacteria bacterium]|nr:serine/threonine protein kinase [Gammaproteobacteria bacterium]